MPIRTGLDCLLRDGCPRIRGQRVGVLCNQASVTSSFQHIVDELLKQSIDVKCVLAPQHGLFGATQDNMIEWHSTEATDIPIYSLYSETRVPTDEMLAGLDVVVIDLFDVGSRYYTFAWTMVLTMRKAAELGLKVIVLDRPNPIGGQREGSVLQKGFESFVGLLPLPQRHGLSLGEIARFEKLYSSLDLDLEVVGYEGEGEAVWVMPSPNMPTRDTALVYPGGCLLEGTNLSEGRGTAKPFETLGAPWLNRDHYSQTLNELDLPGVHFRPVQFQPTFNKYAGQVCDGVFVHVTDPDAFRPVLTYSMIMSVAIEQSGLHESDEPVPGSFSPECAETKLPGFAWRRPPYEYEFEKMPIDILFGNSWCREAISQNKSGDFLTFSWRSELESIDSLLERSKIH